MQQVKRMWEMAASAPQVGDLRGKDYKESIDTKVAGWDNIEINFEPTNSSHQHRVHMEEVVDEEEHYPG